MRQVMFYLVFFLLLATGLYGESDWMLIPLEDVRTGETFTLSEIADRPVLLEIFAVWCPTCTKQQKEVQKLHRELGDSFISVSLDVDPNEDAARGKDHAETHGFEWFYAASPPELTRNLMKEFGTIIVSAPASPMLLISQDRGVRLLDRGVKSAARLKDELLKDTSQ